MALDHVSLNLRDNEFVSVLGPSGSGKTTLLNVIGGLDRYDSGDLIINGISTEAYKDRDWDAYRNHTIGFVFQSYNLIMHQSVLANVELALTIGGVSRKERKARALSALRSVGLSDQAHKKPNQMSGGQMQRVAIARALVNDPDILLADEPTGALDTNTSLQVMDLLKKVAADRLVIMVTHNPELAQQYSTRIVRLKDGRITDDTDPYFPEAEGEKRAGAVAAADVSRAPSKSDIVTAGEPGEITNSSDRLDGRKYPAASETAVGEGSVPDAPRKGPSRRGSRSRRPRRAERMGKASMSLFTAFSLSFNNLLTKKGRTILTSFAGSIGIIGIALILSLSVGFQSYIDSIQEDTLTSYPLAVTAETSDIASALLEMSSQKGEKTGSDVVEERRYISTMFTKIGKNDLTSFKKFLEKEKDDVDDMVSLIRYSYNVQPLIYGKDPGGKPIQLNPGTLMSMMTGDSDRTMSSAASIFYEMIDAPDVLNDQYDVLAGRWPKKYNEAIIVLPEPNGMPDILVYGLGLRDNKEIRDMLAKIAAGENVKESGKALKFTYEKLMNLPLKLVNASDTYAYNETYNVYENLTGDEGKMREIYDNAEDLKLVGVVCAKDGSTSTSLTTGVAYTKDLTSHVMKLASKSEIVKKQLANEDVDVFSNKNFDDDSDIAGINLQDMINVDTEKLKSVFGGGVSEEEIAKVTQSYLSDISKSITADTSPAEKALADVMATMSTGMFDWYMENPIDKAAGVPTIKLSQTDAAAAGYMATDAVKTKLAGLEKDYLIPTSVLEPVFSQLIKAMLTGYIQVQAGNDGERSVPVMKELTEAYVAGFLTSEPVNAAMKPLAQKMTEAVMQKNILSKVAGMTQGLMQKVAETFSVDESKIAEAFSFSMSEEELSRLMETMTAGGVEKNAVTNLQSLGYQDADRPTSVSFYFNDFDAKTLFLDFIDDYNAKMEKKDDAKVIKYTDFVGTMMSAMKTIVDSVSYVLIAFVSVSLVVSSIMIGIITYISVLERTKEIGVLRAIGASKRNISSIFNAETFLIGLTAGVMGILVTLLLLIPINAILYALTKNAVIRAMLPGKAAVILVILSVLLTLIGGIIPSRSAARKDPVAALRSE